MSFSQNQNYHQYPFDSNSSSGEYFSDHQTELSFETNPETHHQPNDFNNPHQFYYPESDYNKSKADFNNYGSDSIRVQ